MTYREKGTALAELARASKDALDAGAVFMLALVENEETGVPQLVAGSAGPKELMSHIADCMPGIAAMMREASRKARETDGPVEMEGVVGPTPTGRG